MEAYAMNVVIYVTWFKYNLKSLDLSSFWTKFFRIWIYFVFIMLINLWL